MAPSEPDSIFRDDLQALDAAGAIRLVARYDDVHGVLDVADLADLVPDLAERPTLACGPAGLLDALAAHHADAGLALTTEQFRTAPSSSPARAAPSPSPTARRVDADGATPILDAAEDAGVLMPSGCRMGICMGCVLPLREGAVRDLRNGEITTAVPGETGAAAYDPDLHQRRRRPVPHRPLTDSHHLKEIAMTTIQKKPENPIAHLTEEDIEQIGIELDAIRQDVLDTRGGRDAAYIRKVIDVQRKLELGSRAVLLVQRLPAGLGARHRRPERRQDPREHGDRPQHPARPVGLDARPEDPLHHLGVGHRLARRAVEARHNELHHTYTNVIGKDNDLGYGIMRVDEDQRWHPLYLGQPLWNFINACFFEYGIAAYDLELGATAIQGEATKDPEFQRRAKDVLAQDPQAGHQGLRRPPGAVDPDRLVPADPGRQLHRQRRAQPVVPLGHHVRPLPRGRRDLREALDRGRDQAASGTSARCSARPTSPAPRPCT